MAAFAKAREKAMYAVGNWMKQDYAQKMAKGSGASNYQGNALNWPALSPFTKVINTSRGEKRKAFNWAGETIRDFGAGISGARGAKEHYFSDAGKAWQSGIRSQLESKYGKMMKRSRDGLFTHPNSTVFKNMKKDALWNEHVTKNQERFMKKRIKQMEARERARQKAAKRGWSRMGAGNKSGRPIKARPNGPMQPEAKLINVVRFKVSEDMTSVKLGFFRNLNDYAPDPNIEKLVRMQVAGYSIPVTSKMRRFFWAIGYPNTKTTLQVPGRPWFGKVLEAMKDKVGPFFKEKFDEYLGKLRGEA
jgi:hypothetical protein